MTEVFADTSYFVSLLGRDVDERQQALDVMSGRSDRLVTTAWVMVELGNYFYRPQHRSGFLALVRRLEADPGAGVIVPPDQRLYEAGLELYAHRPDKE